MFVVGIPFLALLCLCNPNLAKLYFTGKPLAFRRFIIGLAIMLTGALGIEALSNVAKDGYSLGIVTTTEEGLEMLGVSIVLWLIYDVTSDLFPFSKVENC